MANEFISRIKSAAFIRQFNFYDTNPEDIKKKTIVSNIPIS